MLKFLNKFIKLVRVNLKDSLDTQYSFHFKTELPIMCVESVESENYTIETNKRIWSH